MEDLDFTVTPEKVIVEDIKIYKIGRVCSLTLVWKIGGDYTIEKGDTIRISFNNNNFPLPIYHACNGSYMDMNFFLAFFCSTNKTNSNYIDIRYNESIVSQYSMTLNFTYISNN